MAGRKGKRRMWVWAIPAGVALAAALVFKWKDMTPGDVAALLRTQVAIMKEGTTRDPSIEDLQNAILPPMPAGVITLIIAMEDVVLRKEWTSKYGWRYELRPGIKEAFKAMEAAGVVITLWSDGPASGCMEAITKMTATFRTNLSITQTHLGQEHVFHRDGGRKEKVIKFFNRPAGSILLVDWDPASLAANPDSTFLVKCVVGFFYFAAFP